MTQDIGQRETAGQEIQTSCPVIFYPNAGPAQRVAFESEGAVKGARFARQGEARDPNLAPAWGTVWDSQLTRTQKSKIAAKTLEPPRSPFIYPRRRAMKSATASTV